MAYHLINYATYPPGSWSYTQNEGVFRKFGGAYGFDEQAQRIAKFRRANNLARSSTLEAMEDLDAYTCARLGNDPRWCYDIDRPFTEVLRAPGAGCGSCGISVP